MKTYPKPINSIRIKGNMVYIFHNEVMPEIGETISIDGVGAVVVLGISDTKECLKKDGTRAKMALRVATIDNTD